MSAVPNRGTHSDIGMHTEHVPRPVVPPITDSHHAFVRRLRGEPGQRFCVTCGEGTQHPIHKTNPHNTGLTHTGRTTCIECGTAIRKTSVRCKTCSNKRIAGMADRSRELYKARTNAARREETKYTRETR